METYWKESEYIKTIYKELEQIKHENGEWVTPGLKGTLQFAYHLFLNGINGFIMDNGLKLRTLNILTNLKTRLYFYFFLELSEDPNWKATGVVGLSDDETLIDAAVHLHVFSFLRTAVVQHEKFHQEVSLKKNFLILNFS